ncbi:DUF3883 domain-containing protein [Pontibacter anaerobius]|uniref:DUF3883 domain-containing protein n=1 Tax=Pontibacter anaerobius TaxID=2993940 RepID=A0ABT3RJ98_9BACT|nr:DUF3883 domain-containing protein [Pontibacter anaerobius]MCX2741448.1 DUF3883 domain-containing protein [Pontibacter anaerobius]
MQLESTTIKLYAATAKTDISVLPSIAQAEEYLKESYEGRYLFELLQNAVDASRVAGEKGGKVKIELLDRVLRVYNTGKAFDENGVTSVCRIGQSEKQGQDYIGHKGIGFKAVREVTNNPVIRTEFGSVVFNKSHTLRDENFAYLEEENIPLFFFPHYSPEKIEASPEGYVTLIELPLKEEVDTTKPDEDFEEIDEEQIVLLGNLANLTYSSEECEAFYFIKKRKGGIIEVHSHDGSTYFTDLSPSRKVKIPQSVLEKLDKRERKTFENDPTVEIKLILKLGEKKQFKPVENANFYLFYPLEKESGFTFLIHSYFTVTPDRKGFRDTALNDFLLGEIAKYISVGLVEKLKRDFSQDVLKILCYHRVADKKLESFYNIIKENLRKSQFLYDRITGLFYQPKEVIIADECDEELFPDGTFINRRLIFVDNKEVRNWLKDELNIEYLSLDFIKEHIEQECKLRKGDIEFFKNLYRYISEQNLNLTGKKIILADGHHLYTSNDEVFYEGNKKDLVLSSSIKRKIRFLHRSIIIDNSKVARERIGLIQYSQRELLSKLCSLFSDRSIANRDIVEAIFQLRIERSDIDEHRDEILLPYYDNEGILKWANPLYSPIYIESQKLNVLYPSGKYVAIDLFASSHDEQTAWAEFFLKLGAWDRPAIYIMNKVYSLSRQDERNEAFVSLTGRYTRPFQIQFDYTLDFPEVLNRDFSEYIQRNWKHYVDFFSNQFHPRTKCRSKQSTDWRRLNVSERFQNSSFLKILKENAWILIPNADQPLPPSDVIGIETSDYRKNSASVLRQYFNLLPRSFHEQKDFFSSLGILHLNDLILSNYSKILQHLSKKYVEPVNDKDFESACHRVFNLLFEVYAYHSDKKDDRLNVFKDIAFLAFEVTTNRYVWKQAKDIIYIDNKFLFGRLPASIKASISPVFTLRDKNTFGQIASKIGVVLSKSLSKSTVRTAPLRESVIKNEFRFIPELLAFVEDIIERPLTEDEVKKVAEAKVCEQKEVIVKYQLNLPSTVEGFESTEMYSVEAENKDYALLYAGQAIYNLRELAGMLAELIEAVIDKEVKRLGQQIHVFLEKNSKDELSSYLEDNDITRERIASISQITYDHVLDPKAAFWISVASALSVHKQHVDQEFDLESFLKQFDSTKYENLSEIAAGISYDDLLDPHNIPYMKSLLQLLQITLHEYNQSAIQQISFKRYYVDKLNTLKTSCLNGFKKVLWNYMQGKSGNEKEQYVDLVNAYKGMTFLIEQDFLESETKFFLQATEESFPYLQGLESIITPTDGSELIEEKYYLHKEGLKNKLKDKELGDFNLDTFLRNSSKNRSLLYFNEIDELLKRIYKESMASTFTASTSHVSEKDNALEGDDFDIEEYIVNLAQTQGKKESSKNTSGGHNGKNFDGAYKNPKLEEAGYQGELLVYKKLKAKGLSVSWVSRNAYRAKVNPEGSDHYGYDLEYINPATGRTKYVEVKASSYANKTFTITRSELQRALEKGEDYSIVYVENVFDKSKRRYYDLGNIFRLNPGEDFMNNSRFRTVNETFNITLF